MKTIVVGSVALAAWALSAMSAHASCADPRTSSQHMAPIQLNQEVMPDSVGLNAADNIVGTWHAIYTPEGSSTPSGEAFIQWHSDGTEWENINYPVLGGNICMGSWKTLDASHVFRRHYGWLYNNGLLAGYFTEVETDNLSSDGNSYTGTNETILHFYPVPPATTPTQLVLRGTAHAIRIVP